MSESPTHPELIGRSVAAIAAERGCTPFDVVCDVGLDDGLETRFTVTFANDEEDGVALLIQSEGCIMGLSDAGAHVGSICDAVMPTDFLANWVRDRQVVPLETGIRKLTGELGDVLGIDRGYLRPGSPADVVVLDLDGAGARSDPPGQGHARRRRPAGRRRAPRRRVGARQRHARSGPRRQAPHRSVGPAARHDRAQSTRPALRCGPGPR